MDESPGQPTRQRVRDSVTGADALLPDLEEIVGEAQRCWDTERGDRCFDAIVQALYGKAVRWAWHMVGNNVDAREVANAGFLKAWRSLRRYRPGHRAGFVAWLHKIVENEARDFIRRERHTRMPDENRPEFVGYDEAVFQVRARRETPDLKIDLARLLERLPAALRTIFLLRFEDERTVKEIADLLGRCPRWVDDQIRKLRDQLDSLR